MAETQIQRIMSGLKCSEEEAREIMAFDKRIDRGERTEYDLSPEEEKAAKKWANTTSEKKAAPNYKWTTRERKANPTKGGIIAELADFMANTSQYAAEDVVITNKERMIAFRIGDNDYEITLIQKRKKKT
jgi:hypothetical protein